MYKKIALLMLVASGSLYAMKLDSKKQKTEYNETLFPASAAREKFENLPTEVDQIIARFVTVNSEQMLFIEMETFLECSSDQNEVVDILLSRDKDRVITADYGSLESWSVEAGTRLSAYKSPANKHIEAISKIRDKILICSDEAPEIKSIQSFGSESLCMLDDTEQGFEDSLLYAEFNRSGDQLLTVSDEGVAKVWYSDTGTCRAIIPCRVARACFNRAGDEILIVLYSRTAEIRSLVTGQRRGEPIPFITGCMSTGLTKEWAHFNKKGDVVVLFSDHGGGVLVWSIDTGRVVHLDDVARIDAYIPIDYDKKGERIATASFPEPKVWSAQTGECLLSLKGHFVQVHSVKFNKTGTRIVTASLDCVRIWSVDTGDCLATLLSRDDEQFNLAVFNKDGDKVIIGGADGTVIFWDRELIERTEKRSTLEQAFLLKAIYEIILLRRLIKLRAGQGKTVQTEDGRVLKEEDVLFDFARYEQLKLAYHQLAEPIKKVLAPYVKNETIDGGWAVV